MKKIEFNHFKSYVKAVYRGTVRFKQDGFYFYAQLTGRKIRLRRETQNWTVEIYMEGQYQCLGFGDKLIDAEAHAQSNYAFNRRWNTPLYCTNKLSALNK